VSRSGFCVLVVLALCWVLPSAAADPDALWKIVNGSCVPHEQASGDPAPCQLVDLTGGDAVLKDNNPRKATHFLLIPTTRLAGIESPELLAPGAANYWQEAWSARRFVADRAGRPLTRDQIGLAINSRWARSQDQLHIHIDCVAPDVRSILTQNQYYIMSSWSIFPIALHHHRYRVMRVAGQDLRAVRPFQLVARGIPGAIEHMAAETIVVVGAVFADGTQGFYVLNDTADPAKGDLGSGEELLQSCGHG
jgi:CDP-diacylglycerol pyrophosphatase